MQIRQDEARYVKEAVDMDQDGLHIIDQSAIVEEIIEGPTIVESAIKRPKGRRIHRKLLRIVLGGIVTISVVLGLLNQSPGSGAVDTTGTDLHQTTPIPASTPLPTSRPTSKRASPTPKASTTQGVPTSLTPGPLLLLNPGIVRQGSSLSVTGSGFGAKATIDLVLKRQASGTSLASTFVQTDKSGTFDGVSLTLPTELRSGTFIVEAHQRNSDKVAHVVGTVVEDMPQVKLGTQVGTPGDVIAFSVHGFRPGEPINIYWNSMSGQPIATLHADGSGAVAQATVEVPFGTVGTNTFLFVGSKSQALAVASILLLSLYPTVTLSSYAIQGARLPEQSQRSAHRDHPDQRRWVLQQGGRLRHSLRLERAANAHLHGGTEPSLQRRQLYDSPLHAKRPTQHLRGVPRDDRDLLRDRLCSQRGRACVRGTNAEQRRHHGELLPHQ